MAKLRPRPRSDDGGGEDGAGAATSSRSPPPPEGRSRRRRRRRRVGRRRRGEEGWAFAILVVKVGGAVLLIGSVCYYLALFRPDPAPSDGGSDGSEDWDGSPPSAVGGGRIGAPPGGGAGARSDADVVGTAGGAEVDDDAGGARDGGARYGLRGGDEPPPPPPPLPTFDPADFSDWDAYGIAGRPPYADVFGGTSRPPPAAAAGAFACAARRAREEFASLLGGIDAARFALSVGLTTLRTAGDGDGDGDGGGDADPGGVPDGLRRAARRILDARREGRPFKISFGGYSVTAGRGNLHNQSYPFALDRILSPPMEALGVDLEVRNAAVGGVPSFPYGWCLDNFLGEDADAIGWDYSMNEAGGEPGGVEAYLRHATNMRRKPMMILKDTHMAARRRELLQSYADVGFASDHVVVHTDPAAAPFLDMDERHRPPGFRNWREFGSPPNAPGRAPHHPAAAEHELIGRAIGMHFLGALEVAALEVWGPEGGGGGGGGVSGNSSLFGGRYMELPSPIVAGEQGLPRDVSSILYGRPAEGDVEKEQTLGWVVDQAHCRTSFDPVVSGGLSELIVYGTAGDGLDLMLPRGSAFYTKGWVLGLGEAERKAKRRLRRYGGLGFVDSKKAYYGVKTSGALGLFVPYERADGQGRGGEDPTAGDDARKWFRSLVVCEVNEKRGDGECDLGKDVRFVVGGVEAGEAKKIHAAGVSYLGKDVCANVGIPEGARMTTRAEMTPITAQSTEAEEIVGIALEISVMSATVTLKKGPCSVSHVVWQQY